MKRRRRVSVGDLSFFSFQDIITSVTGILLLLTLIMAATITKTVTKPQPASDHPELRIEDDAKAAAAADQQLAADRQIVADATTQAKSLRDGMAVLDEVIRAAGPDASGKAVDVVLAALPDLYAQAKTQLDAAHGKVKALDATIETLKRVLARVDQDAVKAAAERAKQSRTLTFLVGPQTGKPLLLELDASRSRIGDLPPNGQAQLLADVAAGEERTAIDRATAGLAAGDVSVVVLVHPLAVDRLAGVLNDLRSRGMSVGWDVAPQKPIFAKGKESDAQTP